MKRRLGSCAWLMAFCLIGAPIGRAQPQPQRLTFDVASLRVAANQGPFSTIPERSPGRFTWTTQLMYLVSYAFPMQWDRISDVPGGGTIYDLAATMDPASTEDQVRLMVRSLLEDRFKMVWRLETKVSDGWALTVAKGGPKIHEAPDGSKPPPMPDWNQDLDPASNDGRIWGVAREAYVVSMTGRRISMAQLCDRLEGSQHAIFWGRTGLNGKYYIAFRYANPSAPPDQEVDAPPLNAALQESLGLKIEKSRGPAQVLVIDHMEKTPTEN
ncbi:MAG TPA: TIGR03435 family protein [Bryobacteraceae bacterium]|nr:TIGR03435 family protein [Bryobacteraceae bacterium]